MTSLAPPTPAPTADAPALTESAATGKAGPPPGAETVRCVHCGDPCRGSPAEKNGRNFCCNGCELVYELLTENGLGRFYELNQQPGRKSTAGNDASRWTCLDEPEVRQKLLDFSSERQCRITFHLPAIHCVACVWLLENLWRLHAGIGRSEANFARREAAITFDPRRIKLSELAALLATLGYEPSLSLGHLEKKGVAPVHRRLHLQIGVAGFAFGNIMLFSLPQYFGLDSFSGALFHRLFGWLSLLLALPVLLFSARDYWRSALVSFRQKTLTLEVPIAAGLAALFGQSAFEILTGAGEGYLDSLTGLVFFLLCGRLFQLKTHERLAFDRDYQCFFPLSVTRRKGGRQEAVAITELEVGDRILLRHGELIPADARVTEGVALIDYSFVTGESEPVARQPGEPVYAGGRLTGAMVELAIEKPTRQSYLASLWSHAAFGKDREDQRHSLINRYSRKFTLAVVAVALGAAFFWLLKGNTATAGKAFISVLIVACPCALALAAPLTLGTAQRWLAKAGVFAKNTGVLEKISDIQLVVFDKTGTLTLSKAAPPAFYGPPLNPAEKRLVFSLARQSLHPLAARIAAATDAGQSPAAVVDFCEQPGKGLRGFVDGHEILLGSASWLKTHGITATPVSPPGAGSVAHLALDGKARGVFGLENEMRPEIPLLLRRLKGQYQLALLSGDQPREQARFRALFGGQAALRFNQSPLEKLEYIHARQREGRKVMMVGDGLNDAGALQQSDVGVAVMEKSGAFTPASDIIVTGTALGRLDRVLAYARQSARLVRVGFAISAAYNLAGLSVAAAGLLSPLICAILMPLSSVTVVVFAATGATWAARRAGILPVASQGSASISNDGRAAL